MAENNRKIGAVAGALSTNGNSTPRIKFEVFGEEVLEKTVNKSSGSGRVYLPLDWLGKTVKVIRID